MTVTFRAPPEDAPAAPSVRLLRRWEDVFERTGSIRAIALMRILLGPIVVLHLWPFLSDARAGISYDDHFTLPFFGWYPALPGDLYLPLLAVGVAAAVLMSLGLATRVATALTFGVVGYNLLLSVTHYRHNRAFLATLLFVIALLPAGRVLSLDAWLRRLRGGSSLDLASLWPVWLLRVLVSGVYVQSGFSKLIDPDWLSGLILWDRAVRFQGEVPAWVPLEALWTGRELYWLLGPAAVATELLIGLSLWHRRTRLAALWVAVAFHVAIEVTLEVQVFSYAALAALLIWVTPTTRDRVVEIDGGGDTSDPIRRRRVTGPGRTTAALLRWCVSHFDWLARFRLVEGTPRSGVRVVDRDGSVREGWEAVALVSSRLPVLFFLAAPFLALISWRRRAADSPRASV